MIRILNSQYIQSKLKLVFCISLCGHLVASFCPAQSIPQQYQVVDLGLSPVREIVHTPALNNKGDAAVWRSSNDTDARGVFFHAEQVTEFSGKPGFSLVYPADVSDDGTVVGALQAPGDLRFTHAFIWRQGQLEVLPMDSGKYGAATAINRAGEIVGNAQASNGAVHAVVWKAGQVQDIGLLAHGDYSEARDINNQDKIVGAANIAPRGRPYAFTWKDGKMQTLPEVDGSTFCNAQAINDQDEIIGSCGFPPKGVLHGVLWRGDAITDLGIIGDLDETLSIPLDINNHAQIVGTCEIVDGKLRAFVWENGNMKDLNTLIPADSGWLLSVASRINDTGEILGRGYYRDGIHAFLLVPRPAPVPDGQSSK